MLRKELIETLKRYFECSIIFIGIPLAFLLDKLVTKFGWEFKDLFQGVFIAATFLYSVYSGLTVFQQEKKDRALEYFFSLPVQRFKVIVLKIFPRLTILLVHIFVLAFLMSAESFRLVATWLIVLFLISVFLSIVVDSIIIGIIGVILIFQIFSLNDKVIYFLINKTQTENSLYFPYLFNLILSALLILVPLGISFWWTFQKWDLKPLKTQIYPYYYVAIPAILIIISFIGLNYRDYLFWLQNK